MKKTSLALGLILILGFLAYANSLDNPFIWDDQNLIVANPYIKDIRLIKNLFTKDLGYGTQFSNFYRPLQSLSFELDYYLWGLKPFGFHLTNLLLHIGCAVMLYFLFSLIFPRRKSVGLITALFFLVHPVQTEAVTYISGRADSLAGLFILSSLFLYVKHSLCQSRRKSFLLGSSICFILALLSKETALILPFLILLYDISFASDKLNFRDKCKFRYSLFFLMSLTYILLRLNVLNFLNQPLFLSEFALRWRLLSSAKIFALYLSLLILPLHLHMERSLPMVSTIWDKELFFSLALISLLVILAVRSFRSSRVSFFGLIWFVLNLVPVSNIVPLNANMAEHWLYLPSVGLFLLLALGFDRLLRAAKPLKILAIILLFFLLGGYSFLSARRNLDWQDPERFFQNILIYSPDSSEAHNCLGSLYLKQGKIDLAIEQFKQAVENGRYNYKSYGNLASALRQNKQLDLAISVYEQALKLRPDIPGLYNNLGNVYADQGNLTKAQEMFLQALRLYPEFALCRVNLAKVYFDLGKTDLAVQEAQNAIALEPEFSSAHYVLGLIYHKLKQYDLARQSYQRALELNPQLRQAQQNLNRLKELAF
ncbi:MAG: tetratricopeptide repeat protein [Candidatus Omnitrophica bacterium]|nr:tetratricopeptide repeat protein [Candidatus Omnitrophota bacterium]